MCRRIDLGSPNVTQEDLLGRDTEPGVKAMEATKLPTRFDVVGSLVASGLLDVISTDVLQGENADGNKSLSAELSGMNIYGSSTPAFTFLVP
jgi:hypothetical protein